MEKGNRKKYRGNERKGKKNKEILKERKIRMYMDIKVCRTDREEKKRIETIKKSF